MNDTKDAAFAAGMQVRREMFGAAGSEERYAQATDFNRPFEDMVTRYCFGDTWTRPGLDRKTRSLITLAALTALTKPNQLKVHVAGALANGCSIEEIRETILHTAVYAGVPCGVEAFNAAAETLAIQKHFAKKRNLVLSGLKKLGITADAAPAGAFYVWANLSKLPPPLDDGMNFFRECLKEKVIVVPGVFFDVNPGNRRSLMRFKNYCRISFGPEIEKLEQGLDAIERLIKKFK